MLGICVPETPSIDTCSTVIGWSPWFTIRTWTEARLVGWKCQPTLSVTPTSVLRLRRHVTTCHAKAALPTSAAYTETATVIHAD